VEPTGHDGHVLSSRLPIKPIAMDRPVKRPRSNA
jgi:hypothetical protein